MMNFLEQLHIEKNNHGSSTGLQWIESNGITIESYSPVDGKLIGSVIATDQEAFEHIVLKSQDAFTTWRWKPVLP